MPTGAEPSVELQQPQSPEDWLQARQLVEAYAASLNLDLAFQNIVTNWNILPTSTRRRRVRS